MRRAASFSQNKSRLWGNRFPSWRCRGEITPVSTPAPAYAPLARQAMSGALKGTKHRNGKVQTPASAPRSASYRSPRMICGARRQRCAAMSAYRNRQFRCASTIRPPREMTASRCTRLPARFTIFLSSAVSIEAQSAGRMGRGIAALR
jgi:hypothetical protein